MKDTIAFVAVLVIVAAVIGSIATAIYKVAAADGKVSHCYVHSHAGGASGIAYDVYGNVPWGSTRTITINERTLEDAVKQANLYGCQVK